MYVVLEYFNYRKEISVHVHGYTESPEEGKAYVDDLVEDESYRTGEKIIDGSKIESKNVEADNVIYEKSVGDGYDQSVYALIKTEKLKPIKVKQNKKLNKLASDLNAVLGV